MAQFDVYRNDNPDTCEQFPYLLDIQADLHSALSTCTVIPLTRYAKPIRHLNPLFKIEGQDYVAMTQELAGIERAILGERVVSLQKSRDEILDAVDFLCRGF